jgi:hypothetical protein
MAESSANVASSHPSAVGASEVNKLYKVGDKTAPWGTPYGILQTDELDLPTLTSLNEFAFYHSVYLVFFGDLEKKKLVVLPSAAPCFYCNVKNFISSR